MPGSLGRGQHVHSSHRSEVEEVGPSHKVPREHAEHTNKTGTGLAEGAGEISMSDWHDFVSNDATPHGKRLLLITQPNPFDGAQEHVYDIVVGYWNKHSEAFVPADTPASKQREESCGSISGGSYPTFPI
jgi:hypothetical protein